jgi:glycosyltransferase involved in cell wall biosynthesis
MPAKPHLCVFFTKDVSLRTWAETGMLEREIAIYQWLQASGLKVSFVTYGDHTDLTYADQLPGISILSNRWRLSMRQYIRWLPLLHAPHFSRITAVKTNQTNGAEIALRAARFWRKPLIARCGYMWSEFEERRTGANSPQALKASQIECEVFAAADAVVVTTPMMVENVVRRLPSARSKIHLFPNYVETDRFRPMECQPDFDVIAIGRLEPQKNIAALLEALAEMPQTTAAIVGTGSLEAELKQRFSSLADRVTWFGSVPNSDLPALINRSRVFVLPSHYEGHPKALIEAMACGLPVVGGDSPGIREIIEHGYNGLLSATDSRSIQAALERLFADAPLRDQLGRSARSYALEHYALENIGTKELRLIHEVSQR